MEKGGTVMDLERKRGKARERERESLWPGWPANPTRTRDHDSSFSPDSGHLTGRPWYRFEAWETSYVSIPFSSPETDQNAGDLSSKTRGRGLFSPQLISPEFGHISSWVLLLTSPASFSDQPRPPRTPENRRTTAEKLADFGASIRRRQCAWEVTATTVGLPEVWAIRPELPVAVGWNPVTVDRQWHFGNFTVLRAIL